MIEVLSILFLQIFYATFPEFQKPVLCEAQGPKNAKGFKLPKNRSLRKGLNHIAQCFVTPKSPKPPKLSFDDREGWVLGWGGDTRPEGTRVCHSPLPFIHLD